MNIKSLEATLCDEYINQSACESTLESWCCPEDMTIIATQGFEERSLGFIEYFANKNLKASRVFIGSHSTHQQANSRYELRFKQAAEKVSDSNVEYLTLDSNGNWIAQAFEKITTKNIVLDITGIGTRGLFGSLDIAASSNSNVFIAYTEANEYWPKKDDWERLKSELVDIETLPDVVDVKPWLFGYEHTVELIPKHEGYDSAGTGRALIGFLPYKYARLAAIMCAEDYATFEFVAGKPRSTENCWRYDALLEINKDLIKNRNVIEMSTFGYLSALNRLSEIVFTKEALLERYDVHIALMGSKLQDVACWAISSLVPSLTVLTAVPSHYYPEAFSDGIGEKWIFPLTPPNLISSKYR